MQERDKFGPGASGRGAKSRVTDQCELGGVETGDRGRRWRSHFTRGVFSVFFPPDGVPGRQVQGRAWKSRLSEEFQDNSRCAQVRGDAVVEPNRPMGRAAMDPTERNHPAGVCS